MDATISEIKKNQKMAKRARRKRGRAGLIVSLVVIGSILLASGLLFFNVFGLREDVVFPWLRNVPFVSNFIPEESYVVEVEEETIDIEALLNELEDLQALSESQLASITNLENRIREQNQEIYQLRLIEAQQEAHIESVMLFEEMLAAGDPEAFVTFFETMNPIHAEMLYYGIRAELEVVEKWQQLANDLSNMRPAAAAAVVENMINTDIWIVVNSLRLMSGNNRAAILNLLTPETSAAIFRQMQP